TGEAASWGWKGWRIRGGGDPAGPGTGRVQDGGGGAHHPRNSRRGGRPDAGRVLRQRVRVLSDLGREPPAHTGDRRYLLGVGEGAARAVLPPRHAARGGLLRLGRQTAEHPPGTAPCRRTHRAAPGGD